MKAKISLMVITVMLIGLIGGVGTYAWFTSSATSTDNLFTAGTLRIEKTSILGEVPTPLFSTSYSNDNWNAKYATGEWYPGKKVPEEGSNVQRSLMIHNTGSLVGRICGVSAVMKDFITPPGHPDLNGATEEFASNMIITIEWEGTILYHDTLQKLLTSTQPLIQDITIQPNTDPSEVIRLNYKAEMLTSAGNLVQGVEATVDLIVHATQNNDDAVDHLVGD